jgi:Protein of unknown function, DUF481
MKRPALLLVLWLVPAGARASVKTDVVVMRNGDRVTCEIKQLKRGQLQVKTDSMGTLYLEWDDVARLTTPVALEVQLASGERSYGTLGPASRDGRLLVETVGGPVELDMREVVSFWPVRSRFWKRIDGSLSLGASYTQSNSLLQITPSFGASYTARSYWLNLDTSATLTRQEGEEDADRANTTASYVRSFSHRWAAFGQVSGQRNTELGIDWRVDLAGGAGRLLVSSNRSLLFLGAGLAATREHPRDEESTTNLESLLTFQWQVFSYDFPKTNGQFSFMLYPSLTEGGRVRGDVLLSLKRELLHDFTVGLEFYDSFDNRPATEGAAKNDWGATLSLGWTF